jgi:hypothetical protein
MYIICIRIQSYIYMMNHDEYIQQIKSNKYKKRDHVAGSPTSLEPSAWPTRDNPTAVAPSFS